jgi:hypothetical protein
VSSTPAPVNTYTYTLWASEVVQIPLGGGSAWDTKSVNLGDPSKIQILSAVYRGAVEMLWSGITYAEYILYVDGIETWRESWTAVGGRREKTIDLTSRLSGGGIHTFKSYIWCFGSNQFVVDGYLDVQYTVIESGATLPTGVTTVGAPSSSSEGLADIMRFVENIMPLVMLIVIAILFRSIVDSLKPRKEEKSEK